MQQTNLLTRSLILLSCLVLSNSLFALAADKNQPIGVEADSVDVNQTKGFSIYKGNVIITQGSIRLKANQVTITQVNGKTDNLTAIGNPVHFRQKPNGKKTYVKVRGNKVEYKIQATTMYVTGNAELLQDGNSFKSDRIIYNRETSTIKGGSAAKGKQRVKMTIQ